MTEQKQAGLGCIAQIIILGLSVICLRFAIGPWYCGHFRDFELPNATCEKTSEATWLAAVLFGTILGAVVIAIIDWTLKSQRSGKS